MKTALFIMLPYPSHYFVGFGKANRLKQEEYHVVFTGLKTHQTLVEREGFAFESLLYASQYKRLTWKMGLAIFIQSSLNKAYTIKRYYTFWEEVKAIQDLAQKIMPDLVFIDSHLGHYVLYLWQTQCEKIILNTKLSSYPSKGIPPLTEGWTANETLLAVYRAWCNWQWHFMKRTWKKWIEKMVFLCKDDEWLHRRLAQKTGKSLDQWFEYKHCFYPAVKGLPKLITYPQAIEYPWKKTRADEIYEIIPFQRHETHLFSEEYNQLITHLQHLKTQHPTTKIIYANLGTTGLNNTPEGVQTLKK
ncbi:MAG: hypothetical protein R2822_02130 [Spirosomataceae bacterium]